MHRALLLKRCCRFPDVCLIEAVRLCICPWRKKIVPHILWTILLGERLCFGSSSPGHPTWPVFKKSQLRNFYAPAAIFLAMTLVQTLVAGIAAGFVVLSTLSQGAEAIVIDTIWSTPWNYSVRGGVEPNLVQRRQVSINFKPIGGDIVFPTASVNLTNGDAVIGVEVHDMREFQQMKGAGCGITDGASISLQDYKNYRPNDYNDLMNLLFNQVSLFRVS